MEILYLISADADKPDARWGPNPHANSFGFQQISVGGERDYLYFYSFVLECGNIHLCLWWN